VQGFLRELQAPVEAAFLVVGVAAVVGGTISCWCKLDKLECSAATMQKSFADLDTKIGSLDAKMDLLGTRLNSTLDEILASILTQRANDRWYNLCLVGLGGTVVYMAAKPW
jgi:hypothetical protein